MLSLFIHATNIICATIFLRYIAWNVNVIHQNQIHLSTFSCLSHSLVKLSFAFPWSCCSDNICIDFRRQFYTVSLWWLLGKTPLCFGILAWQVMEIFVLQIWQKIGDHKIIIYFSSFRTITYNFVCVLISNLFYSENDQEKMIHVNLCHCRKGSTTCT